MRKNAFSFFLIIIIIPILFYLPSLFDCALMNATCIGESKKDCNPSGACWALIYARWEQFIYGFYPISNIWRVNFSLGLLGIGLVFLSILKISIFRRVLFVTGVMISIVYLLYGNLGLSIVPTNL